MAIDPHGRLRFLFDYVSPYAYLASTQIRAVAARHGREVEPVPVLFAALLDASGARGPAEIPLKRGYLFKDILRLGAVLGVPIEPPATHPFNPLLSLRVTGLVEDVAARWRLVDALFCDAWARSQPVDHADVVARAATLVGLDGAALVEQASNLGSKARLRQATESAVSAGVFGVPTVLVEDELFWGVDSLPLLDRFLGGERAADAARVERWLGTHPSANRRSAN